ncbi:MAG: choice-of-anchor D domain-containing protein [Cyanobacteria bacterium J06642_2]
MSAVVPPDDRLSAGDEPADTAWPRVRARLYDLTLGPWGAELERSTDEGPEVAGMSPEFALPPAPADVLDRDEIVREAIAAISTGQPVVLCGGAGVGKSTLLHHLAHHPDLNDAFAGGILYLNARHLSNEDVVQAIYDASAGPTNDLKLSGDRLNPLLKELSIAVLLDNTTGERAQVEALAQVLPHFICTGDEPYAWEEGCVIEVTGVTGAAAIALIERELGRSLRPEERSVEPNVSALLDGNPLSLQQVGAFLRHRSLSLTDFFRQGLSDASAGPLLQSLLIDLNDDKRQLMTALTAIAPGATGVATLSRWLDLNDGSIVLASLRARHLVLTEGDRVRVAGNLIPYVPAEWDVEQQRDLWLTQWVEHLDPAALTDTHVAAYERSPEDDVDIARAMQYGIATQRWSEVAVLGTAMADEIAAGKRWGLWQQVLEFQQQAAHSLSDLDMEARATHQLGAKALASGDLRAAYDALLQAERQRERLNVPEALVVTRRALLLALAERPVRGAGFWQVGGLVLASTLVAVAGMWGWYTYLMPRPAIATVGRTHLDFRQAQIERDIRRRALLVESQGLSPVEIIQVELGGDRPEDFAIVENTCETSTPIPPEESCIIGIEFKPTTEGGRTAQLEIATNSEAAIDPIVLTGIGTAPKIALDIEGMVFGALPVSVLSQAKVLSVLSQGTAPVDIASVEFGGPHASDFRAIEDTCSPPPPPEEDSDAEDSPEKDGGEEDAKAAATTGAQTDDATPESAADTSGDEAAEESATAASPESASDATTEDADAGSESDAAPENAADESVESADEGETGTDSEVAVSEADAEDSEAADTSSQGILEPEQDCTISVAFAPSGEGARTATLTVNNNALEGPQAIALSGTGVVPRLSVNLESLAFGSNEVGSTTAAQSFVVTSRGSASLRMGQLFVTGSGKPHFRIVQNTCASGAIIPPGRSCSLSIVYAPTESGTHRAQVTVTSNAPDGSRTITFSGTGAKLEPESIPEADSESAAEGS